jgi:NarL family two-component system sensor histidine kinase LiaS
MDFHAFLPNRFRQLRWKLTLSYTGVTVATLLVVELVLYGMWIGGLTFLINSGILPAQLIESAVADYAWELQPYLTASPPDYSGVANWLDRIRPRPGSIGFNIDETDGLLVVGHDGLLLATSPSDFVASGTIGQPLDPQSIPGLAEPLRAALAGEEDTGHLYTIIRPDNQLVIAVPIWDANHERVLGVLIGVIALPTAMAHLRELIQILGLSLLPLTLIAGLIGTVFGSLAARGLVRRFNRLATATLAWSDGDFTVFVDDPTGDELGQLAQRLNHMARQLQHLLDTRRELAIVEERNRLARDLHDSVKQQAFATAAQLSVIKALLKRGPEAAEPHVEEAERLIYELRQELTHLIQELRPAALQGKGLALAVREYATDWSRQSGIELEVRVQGERSLPLNIEQAAFRILQEALANIARHSRAHNAEINLIYTGFDVTCTIRDDGIGFDPDKTRDGFGLRSMRERAGALGSTLEVESVASEGTRLSFTISLGESPESKEMHLE